MGGGGKEVGMGGRNQSSNFTARTTDQAHDYNTNTTVQTLWLVEEAKTRLRSVFVSSLSVGFNVYRPWVNFS